MADENKRKARAANEREVKTVDRNIATMLCGQGKVCFWRWLNRDRLVPFVLAVTFPLTYVVTPDRRSDKLST